MTKACDKQCAIPLTLSIDMDEPPDEPDGLLPDMSDGIPYSDLSNNYKVPLIPPLAKAIQYDDAQTVSSLLANDPPCANTDSFQDLTPLMMSCQTKNIAILKMLINAGAKIMDSNSLGHTALHAAATEHWLEGAKILIEHGASVNAIIAPKSSVRGIFRESPLHHAVRTGDLDMVLLMLGREDEISSPGIGGDKNVGSPGVSGSATRFGGRDASPIEYRSGSPIWNSSYSRYNRFNRSGRIRSGDNTPTVNKALKIAPDLTRRDGNNRSFVHLAAMSRSKDILDIILSYKESEPLVLTRDVKDKTPLHLLFWDATEVADEDSLLECVEILLSYGIDVNCMDIRGHTPLFMAITRKLSSIVFSLLCKGADPLLTSDDGWTTLHAACNVGCSKCLKYLLDTGLVNDLISKESGDGRTPFHLATCSYSLCCIKLLLKIKDHLTNMDSSGNTRFSLLMNNVPSAKQLLTELFNEQITESKHRDHEADYAISFDYSMLLQPTSEVIQCSLVSELTTNSHMESLLMHPLIESFLFLKWNRIRPFFYTNFMVYLMFCILHTFYVSITFSREAKDWSQSIFMLNTFRGFHLILFLLILIPDMIFLLANFKKYFQQWETYIKLVALSTSAYILFSRNVESAQNDMEVERHLAAISAFFTWAEMMMLIGRFPVLGVYILMFTKTARAIITFLLAFSSLLIGFAIAFQILFVTINDFRNFPASFVKTLMMMIGEIDYGAIVEQGGMSNSVLGYIFLVVFLFLVPILMANLLIGLAVSDIPDLNRQGITKRLSKQASYLTAYELLIKFFKELRCFPRVIRNVLARRCEIQKNAIFYPNKRHFRQTSCWKKWAEQMPDHTIKAASEVVRIRNENPPDSDDESSTKIDAAKNKNKDETSSARANFLRSLSVVSKNTNPPDCENYQKLLDKYEKFTTDYKKDFKNLKIYIRSHLSENVNASPKFRHYLASRQMVARNTKNGTVSETIKTQTGEENQSDLAARILKLEQIIESQNNSLNMILKNTQKK